MPAIADVVAVPTLGGYFFDDKEAIVTTADRDGFSYAGEPVTPGFSRVRQPAEAISVQIELTNGRIGVGECTAVQYSGFGGRDVYFDADSHLDDIEATVSDALVGRDASDFTNNVATIDEVAAETGGLHTAVRYGLSQALLETAAIADSKTMTEVITDAYDLDLVPQPVPIFTQSGSNRYDNAEKMILKRVPVLPHGLFNSVDDIGADGERLLEYLSWLSERISELGSSSYRPTIHLDIYGTVGEIFDPPYDTTDIVDYFAELERAASPYQLRIESPIEAGSRSEQITALGTLRDALTDHSIPVDIVADEFCNTYEDVTAFVDADAVDMVQIKMPDLGDLTNSIDAVRYCSGTDILAYLGGSCAETDISARVSTHVGLATRPDQLLAKPGMGVDEPYLITNNEMKRTLRRLA
ncbi:methylaspartate ammonia-lyase [Natrarchaeobius halalkaliphilus]|uniref:methylaspartate ammonia-lyase n=1 Tax=Natrarchaeobius halalkaliphilus TaxID=1679091 RepID=A0A3N6LJ24_9EURY|nr:methylaspartate ammonia-lyase [Natrarchaeobius halalkaliphilus]RQG88046.1 methylaspartate ammonia-lyase [Natrarchaeobius halalkaliphilus]